MQYFFTSPFLSIYLYHPLFHLVPVSVSISNIWKFRINFSQIGHDLLLKDLFSITKILRFYKSIHISLIFFLILSVLSQGCRFCLLSYTTCCHGLRSHSLTSWTDTSPTISLSHTEICSKIFFDLFPNMQRLAHVHSYPAVLSTASSCVTSPLQLHRTKRFFDFPFDLPPSSSFLQFFFFFIIL